VADSLLYDVCEELLEFVVDALDDPPPTQAVVDGDPMTMFAFCPAVWVAMAPNGLFQSINVAARGPSLPARPTTKTALPQLVLKVWVINDVCWPTQTDDGGVPDAADINAHSLAVLTDRQDVWVALREEAQAGTLLSTTLTNGNNGCSIEPPTTAFGPQGMVAGSIFSVFVDYLRLQPSS
jgi:hypothetical protein